MEIILKISQACTFKCTFCSSTKISESNSDYLDINYVFDFLKRFPNTNTIIVNGGDPLVVKPDYYIKILEYLDANNLDTSLSFTTNLWDFYKHPEKWIDIFKHERVGVNTSFQYDLEGKGRLKPDYTNYTEVDFWKISDLVLEKVGYRPDFISVITKDNEHLAIKNVELAKKMSNGIPPTSFNGTKTGVECKLNYAMASGPPIWREYKGMLRKMGQEGDPYMLSDIYKIYVDIYDKGLANWEFNTKQMMKRINSSNTSCPQNRKCDEGIRCLQPTTNRKGESTLKKKYYSCGAFGDDLDKDISFEEEVYNGKFFTPLQNDKDLFSLKRACLGCPMFSTCNGCRKQIKDSKAKGQEYIEEHCFKMKQLAPKILEINGFNKEEISKMITPYINENT